MPAWLMEERRQTLVKALKENKSAFGDQHNHQNTADKHCEKLEGMVPS